MKESTHGREPGSLAALAMAREQRTRAVLAELGMPPESAAVSLKAAMEAPLQCRPRLKDDAMTQAELFKKATIPSKTTSMKALQQLLSARWVERGVREDPYRYFNPSRGGQNSVELRAEHLLGFRHDCRCC